VRSEPNMPMATVGRFRRTMRYHNGADTFVVTYESFVDGKLGDLENFLSMNLGSREFETSRSHNARSGKYGAWRSWFVPEDIPVLRPLLGTYLRRYGYDDDWELPEQPVIDPTVASGYIERSCRARREQVALLRGSTGSSDERKALLRARADTGRTSHALNLATVLLADGGAEAAAEAAERLTFAACTGSPKAMVRLANCYRDGVGVAKNRALSKFWRAESRSLRGESESPPAPDRAADTVRAPATHTSKSPARRIASRVKRTLERAVKR